MPRLPTTDLVKRPRSEGFHARLGELYVRLGPQGDRPYVTTLPEADPPRIDTAQSPEEFVTSDGQTFARTDFSGGEGLARAHRRNQSPNDYRQFWDSQNLRAPLSGADGHPLYLDMSRSWRSLGTSLTDIFAVVTVPNTERVVLVGTTGWEAWEDLDDTAPTLADSAALVGALAAAAYGNTVYVVDGSTTLITITDDGAGNFTAGTEAGVIGGNWDKVWAAKNRLILNDGPGNSLYEYTPGAAAPATEITAERLIDTPYEWTKVIDAGEVIAASATDGSIYFFTPDPTGATTDLVLVSSTPLPQDERVIDMAFNQGVLLIGTNEFNWVDGSGLQLTGRLYQATVGTGVEDIQLVKRFGEIAGPTPANFVTTRDSIFFTTRDGSNLEVWRFLLPTFGLFREDKFPADAEDAVGFANPGQSGMVAQSGSVWLETTDATAEDAWIILPAADFFTAKSKAWTGLTIDGQLMPPGAEVHVLVSTEYEALFDWMDPSWQTVRVLRDGNTDADIPLNNTYGRWLVVQMRFYGGTSNQSPEIVSITAHGRVEEEGDVELSLPVIVSDTIERPHRQPVRSRGYGEMVRQALFDIKGRTIDVELFNPNTRVQGVITAIQGAVPVMSRRGHRMDVAQVLISGRLETGESSALVGGPGSMGVSLLGVEPILGGTFNG